MTDILDGITYHTAPVRAAETERAASQTRLAATLVRRFALGHQCGGPGCRHRNHRRDAEHARFLCEALSIPPEPARPADYDMPLLWASLSRGELR